jgi:hypothetical protein
MGQMYGIEAYESKGSGIYKFGQKEVTAQRLIRCRGQDAVTLAGKLWWSTQGSVSNMILYLPPSHPRCSFIYVNEINVRPFSETDKISFDPADGMILNQWCLLEINYKSLSFEQQDAQFQTVYTKKLEYGGEIMSIPPNSFQWNSDHKNKTDPTTIWIGHIILKLGFPMVPQDMQINEPFLYTMSQNPVNPDTFLGVQPGYALFTGATTDYTTSMAGDPTTGNVILKQARTVELAFDIRSQLWNQVFRPSTGKWENTVPQLYANSQAFSQFQSQLFIPNSPQQQPGTLPPPPQLPTPSL